MKWDKNIALGFYKVTHVLPNPDTLCIGFVNSLIKISQRMSFRIISIRQKHLCMHLQNINNVHVDADPATEQALSEEK